MQLDIEFKPWGFHCTNDNPEPQAVVSMLISEGTEVLMTGMWSLIRHCENTVECIK